MVSTKKRRGAQPRNRNALKHGLYSREGVLSAADRAELLLARRVPPEDLDEEIALLRQRVMKALRAAPDRPDLHVQTLRALMNMVAMRHRLQSGQAVDFGDAIEAVWRELGVELVGEEGV